MEAVLLHSSADQSISQYKAYKHIRNPKRSLRPLMSGSFENFAAYNFHGGIFHAPPSSFSSYPPPVSFLNPQQQPPLLPLPISKPSNNSLSRGLSCPPINRKINGRKREQSLNPKKSKPSVSPKKGDSKRDLKPKTTTASSECLIIASANPLGPEPNELPKDVSRVLSSSAGSYTDLEKVSSSAVFTLSPPPSSLPLPTFSLKPKLSCNAVAGGIDAGATDNLRRLLRLR